ncbi:unnamed protein product, partial [Meganyctiphanes norvegica]
SIYKQKLQLLIHKLIKTEIRGSKILGKKFTKRPYGIHAYPWGEKCLLIFHRKMLEQLEKQRENAPPRMGPKDFWLISAKYPQLWTKILVSLCNKSPNKSWKSK